MFFILQNFRIIIFSSSYKFCRRKNLYGKFRNLVVEKGIDNVKRGLMSEQTTNKIVKKMDSIYQTIRRSEHERK